jgi:hypothetical protein
MDLRLGYARLNNTGLQIGGLRRLQPLRYGGVDDKRAVAEAKQWHGCVDVSRELALYLCPY